MCEKKSNVNIKDSSEVAENNYELLNQSETEHERGLAETHEQVSDGYFEGTIDQVVLNEKLED